MLIHRFALYLAQMKLRPYTSRPIWVGARTLYGLASLANLTQGCLARLLMNSPDLNEENNDQNDDIIGTFPQHSIRPEQEQVGLRILHIFFGNTN